jgi:hypothetical protein
MKYKQQIQIGILICKYMNVDIVIYDHQIIVNWGKIVIICYKLYIVRILSTRNIVMCLLWYILLNQEADIVATYLAPDKVSMANYSFSTNHCEEFLHFKIFC